MKALVLIAALFALSGAASAAPEGSARPFTMERTATWTMESAQGTTYRLYVHTPEAPPPEAGYPVLYLLDGDDTFAIAAATSERFTKYAADHGFEAGLIVAIGYEGATRRFFDYTPASPLTEDRAGRPLGGANAFRKTLIEEIRPQIEAAYEIDPSRQAIFGHSFGGLFILDTLLEDPFLFDTWVMASPSIWFGGRAVLENEDGLAGRLDSQHPRRVVITAGELETRVPPALSGQSEAPLSLRGEVEALAARWSDMDGVSVDARILSQESHGATMLSGVGLAVMYAFAGGPL